MTFWLEFRGLRKRGTDGWTDRQTESVGIGDNIIRPDLVSATASALALVSASALALVLALALELHHNSLRIASIEPQNYLRIASELPQNCLRIASENKAVTQPIAAKSREFS